MNKIVKVYSHKRSGTNFLCGLLYINYYKGMSLESGEDHTGIEGKFFVTLNGNEVNYNQWGKLFGSHELTPPPNLDLSSSIYIKRDPVDTAYSLYNLPITKKNFCGSFEDYINTGILKRIELHHKNWEGSGIYTVEYEHLYYDVVGTLEKIESNFGLSRINPDVQMIGKVGWTPGKAIPHEGRRVLNENR